MAIKTEIQHQITDPDSTERDQISGIPVAVMRPAKQGQCGNRRKVKRVGQQAAERQGKYNGRNHCNAQTDSLILHFLPGFERNNARILQQKVKTSK